MRFIVNVLSALVLLFAANIAIAEPYSYGFCNDSRFTCYEVQKGQTWDKLFPDAKQREVVMRLNRMNIQLSRGMIIAVPNDLQKTTVMDISPFSLKIPPSGHKLIVVDPSQLAWGAYAADGNLVKWGPMSGGKGWCPDTGQSCRTSIGDFSVYRMKGAGCESTKFPIPYGGAPMPYCMFFNGGYAIHASPQVPGYHASHGCVRVFYDDAQWLNQNFVEIGTTVIVHPYT